MVDKPYSFGELCEVAFEKGILTDEESFNLLMEKMAPTLVQKKRDTKAQNIEAVNKTLMLAPDASVKLAAEATKVENLVTWCEGAKQLIGLPPIINNGETPPVASDDVELFDTTSPSVVVVQKDSESPSDQSTVDVVLEEAGEHDTRDGQTTIVAADRTVSDNDKHFVDEPGHAIAQQGVEGDLQDLDQQYDALVAAGLPGGGWHDLYNKARSCLSTSTRNYKECKLASQQFMKVAAKNEQRLHGFQAAAAAEIVAGLAPKLEPALEVARSFPADSKKLTAAMMESFSTTNQNINNLSEALSDARDTFAKNSAILKDILNTNGLFGSVNGEATFDIIGTLQQMTPSINESASVQHPPVVSEPPPRPTLDPTDLPKVDSINQIDPDCPEPC